MSIAILAEASEKACGTISVWNGAGPWHLYLQSKTLAAPVIISWWEGTGRTTPQNYQFYTSISAHQAEQATGLHNPWPIKSTTIHFRKSDTCECLWEAAYCTSTQSHVCMGHLTYLCAGQKLIKQQNQSLMPFKSVPWSEPCNHFIPTGATPTQNWIDIVRPSDIVQPLADVFWF